MPRKPNLQTLAKMLTNDDLAKLLEMKQRNPKLERLEARRAKVAATLAALDVEIAREKGESAPKRRGRPAKVAAGATLPQAGKRRGRPALVRLSAEPASAATAKKRGRPFKVDKKIMAEIQQRDRKKLKTVLAEHEAAKKAEKKAKRTPEQQAAIDARMAKARAARAANQAAKK